MIDVPDEIVVELGDDPEIIEVEVPQDIDAVEVEVPQEIDLIEVMVPGEQGPPGRDGSGAVAVEYAITYPSASWSISHNLGRRPTVTVYDADGNWLLADYSATSTTVNVVHATARTGSIVVS